MSQLSGNRKMTLGPIDIIKNTFSSKGVAGFYKGCGPVVIGIAVKAGTRLFTYETLREQLRASGKTSNTASNVLAGIGAGCVESIVAVTPSEAIK